MLDLPRGKYAAAIRYLMPERTIVRYTGDEPSPDSVSLQSTFERSIAAIKEVLSPTTSSILIDEIGHFSISPVQGDGRLFGKVAVVTESAEGFGYELACALYEQGAYVALTDADGEKAKTAAKKMGERAYGFGADLVSEPSVASLVEQIALMFGGIDLWVNNTYIPKELDLKKLEDTSFGYQPRFHYNAYYLCTRYVAELMKTQHSIKNDCFMDIIHITSHVGYAGSEKSIGRSDGNVGRASLTQNFALELVPYKIKVNAVCPGIYYDGPLWMDPEKGLFAQYLRAGKMPRLHTVEEVKQRVVDELPSGRGCRPTDVAKAILYCVEQEYEIGQTIPVTGGKLLLLG